MVARHDPGPSGRWAPLGLRQRQKTTAGAARPAAGWRPLIDERAGPLNGGAAQALQGERHEGPSLPHRGAGVGGQEVDEAHRNIAEVAAVFAD